MAKLKPWISPIIILITSIIIAYLNYLPGTSILGWDNLFPEWDFRLNLMRTFNATWQEYQGLGLVGGMGHAAELPKQLYLWLAHFVLPTSSLRYLYVFTCLFLGALGMYFLMRKLVWRYDQSLEGEAGSLAAALFYLLCLHTVQNFYLPIEMFVTHFAALPWLILFLGLYIKGGQPRYLIYFGLVSFLFSTQALTPTIFVVLCLALALFFMSYLLVTRSKIALRKVALAVAVLLVTNAYWALPFGYFVVAHSGDVLKSKSSQVVSDDFIRQNTEYGTFADFALERGFQLSYADWSGEESSWQYMFKPWRDHLYQPQIEIIGYLIFGVATAGLIFGIWKKQPLIWPMTLWFGVSFFALMSSNPPFGFIFNFIRDHSRYLAEVFRTPYTKFSTLSSFTLAYLFGVGGFLLTRFFKTIFKPLWFAAFFNTLLLSFLLVAYAWPTFQGQLIYDHLKLPLPEAYSDLMSYLNTQDPTLRILYLPIRDFAGWRYYDFGYRGSGFLWYGVRQPIIDRAFDIWSPTDETAFTEIADSVYTGDPARFQRLLNNYNISYLLLDGNVTEPTGLTEALLTPKISSLLTTTGGVSLEKTFGKLALYRFQPLVSSDQFVSTPPNISLVGPATPYLTRDVVNESSSTATITFTSKNSGAARYFPFRNLERNSEVSLSETADSLIFESTLPTSSENRVLNLPIFGVTDINDVISARLVMSKTASASGSLNLAAYYLIPQVYVDSERVSKNPQVPFASASLLAPATNHFWLVINKQYQTPIEVDFTKGSVADLGLVSLHELSSNQFEIFDANDVVPLDLTANYMAQPATDCGGQTEVKKVSKDNGRGEFLIWGADTIACVWQPLTVPKTRTPYLINFALDFRSSQQEAPYACVKKERTGASCLNGNFSDRFLPSPTYDSASQWTYLDSGLTDYFLDIGVDRRFGVGSGEMRYKNINFSVYPKVGEASVNLANEITVENFGNTVLLPREASRLTVVIPKSDSLMSANKEIVRKLASSSVYNAKIFSQGTATKETSAGDSPLPLTYQGIDATVVESINLPDLSQDFGYVVTVSGENVSGQGMKIYVQNSYTKNNVLEDLTTSKAGKFTRFYTILPENVGHEGYAFYLHSQSFHARDTVVNKLNSLTLNQVPLMWIKNVSVGYSADTKFLDRPNMVSILSVQKWGTVLYKVTLSNSNDSGLLVLNQSFEPGWGLLGQGEHVLVNNWANGWLIPRGNYSVYIFFWPQLLQYLGFGLLILFLIYCSRYLFRLRFCR